MTVPGFKTAIQYLKTIFLKREHFCISHKSFMRGKLSAVMEHVMIMQYFMPFQNKQHSGALSQMHNESKLHMLHLTLTPKCSIIARDRLGNLNEYKTTNISCCAVLKMNKDTITQQVMTHLYTLLIISVVSIESQSRHMCKDSGNQTAVLFAHRR